MNKDFKGKLIQEILQARGRVYNVGSPTPLEPIFLNNDFEVFIKREDLGPINAYKWRGAYNCARVLVEREGCKDIVCASAGNHAQGVALAAKELGINAKIFMPLSTPQMKQVAVKKHGGNAVEIILKGDDYNVAAIAAKEYVKKHKLTYVHPFDDIYTLAGQATIADEIILSGQGDFDMAFLQIGGGGMAAGVAAWLKIHYPDITIIGVEETDQACLKAAIKAGKPVTLPKIDTFCDGTAVTRIGDMTFDICHEVLDDVITVTNEQVCAAIQTLWEAKRIIPEPSGALGLAGIIHYANKYPEKIAKKKVISIISGANMDFSLLARISRSASIGANKRHYLCFHISEKNGSLLNILDSVFSGVNVNEFLYGKINETEAWPIIAFEADSEKMLSLENNLRQSGLEFKDITDDPDIRYRIINYNPALFKNPLLCHIHFPERKGALRDFLRDVAKISNICYFNYAYSGESIGRALIGFEFDKETDQKIFLDKVEDSIVNCFEVEPSVKNRILRL